VRADAATFEDAGSPSRNRESLSGGGSKRDARRCDADAAARLRCRNQVLRPARATTTWPGTSRVSAGRDASTGVDVAGVDQEADPARQAATSRPNSPRAAPPRSSGTPGFAAQESRIAELLSAGGGELAMRVAAVTLPGSPSRPAPPCHDRECDARRCDPTQQRGSALPWVGPEPAYSGPGLPLSTRPEPPSAGRPWTMWFFSRVKLRRTLDCEKTFGAPTSACHAGSRDSSRNAP